MVKMVPQVTGNTSSLRNFFLRCSPNWIIDLIFEIELGCGNCFDWHETWRNEASMPKFAKNEMGLGEPIFGRNLEQIDGTFLA